MTTEIQTTGSRDLARVAESLVTKGDLSGLTLEERARHYIATCESHGLNPHSQPFSFLTLNGKLVMYANRGCTDQLAAMHHVNRKIIDGPRLMDLGGTKIIYCMAEASLPNGRTETAIATVPMTDPVMVLMKAETKAKRRATLSILGLGMLDETEAESIPGAVRMEAVRLDVRDDAPAQLAAPDALAAFVADLASANDLTSVRDVYARHDLGGTAAKPITSAIVTRLGAIGYHLNAADAAALIGGTMPDAVAVAHDELADVTRHADDEDGDGVVADVARILRRCGGVDAPARVKTAAVATCTALGVEGAAARIKAALSPQPPTTPTGTDAPRAASPDASGGSVAPSATAGAQAIGPRVVLDTDASHVQVAGTWRESEAGWAAHLGEMTVRRRVEASVGCNGALLGPRFVAMAASRIVEIDAARPLPAGVARLTVLGVTQTLERVALDGSLARAAAAQQAA